MLIDDESLSNIVVRFGYTHKFLKMLLYMLIVYFNCYINNRIYIFFSFCLILIMC